MAAIASRKGLLRQVATLSVIAAVPLALVAAYLSNLLAPTVQRPTVEYDVVVGTNASATTVGAAVAPP